ncbi:MAG TPA: hypothetical protein VF023_02155 [Bryobacteraceae bacterium]
MKAVGFLLRFYSYVFHLAVSFFFLFLGAVSITYSAPLHLDAIGLSDRNALFGVFILGIVGLFSTLLALTGTFRLLFPLWAAFIVWLMIKGFFLSTMTFSGPSGFGWAVLCTLGGIAAFIGAAWTLRRRRAYPLH